MPNDPSGYVDPPPESGAERLRLNRHDQERRAHQVAILDRVRGVELGLASLRQELQEKHHSAELRITEHHSRLRILEETQREIADSNESIARQIRGLGENMDALMHIAKTWRDARVIFRITRAGGRAILVMLGLAVGIVTAIHYGRDIWPK